MDTKRNSKFTPVGEAREIDVTPIGDGPNKMLSVQYGHLSVEDKDGNAKPDVHRFEVVGESVVEGRVINMYHYATSGKAAVTRMVDTLYRAFELTSDDVDMDVDFEDEYYAQKIKPVTDDVWKMEKFAESTEELDALRMTAETALAASTENTADAFQAQYALSVAVNKAIAMMDGNMKLAVSWARGHGEGSGNSKFAKLGNGVNALTELTYLGKLSEAELVVIPRTVTSGKAVDRHSKVSCEAVVSGVPMSKDVVIGENGLADAAGCAMMLRLFAKTAGVTEAVDKTDEGEYIVRFTELADAYEAAAAQVRAEFFAMYGEGNINMYNKAEAAAAKYAYGVVQASQAGSGTFAAACAAVMSEETDYKKLLGAKGNQVLRTLNAVFAKHSAAVVKEAETRKLLEDVKDKEGPISKTAAVGFAKLEAPFAAAHLFKLIGTHQKRADVWAELKALVSNSGMENDPDKIAAE